MQNTSHAVMAQRTELKNSLDDFPTPPWAIRALIEHVIVVKEVKMKMKKLTIELEKLLRKVEAASEGSPELDAEFASIFSSAPANVTRSIDAVVQLIETELPGWWWTCGYCKLSNDASLYAPGSSRFPWLSNATVGPDFRSGPEVRWLLDHPKWGRLFDNGFHCDMRGGSVPLSMLLVFLKAKIAVAKAGPPPDWWCEREEVDERLRKRRLEIKALKSELLGMDSQAKRGSRAGHPRLRPTASRNTSRPA